MNTNEPHADAESKQRKTKASPLVDAFFVGFLVGIVVYSLAVSSWGFFTLIPLYLIYRLLKKPKVE